MRKEVLPGSQRVRKISAKRHHARRTPAALSSHPECPRLPEGDGYCAVPLEETDEDPGLNASDVRRKQGRIQATQILAALHQVAMAPLPLGRASPATDAWPARERLLRRLRLADQGRQRRFRSMSMPETTPGRKFGPPTHSWPRSVRATGPAAGRRGAARRDSSDRPGDSQASSASIAPDRVEPFEPIWRASAIQPRAPGSGATSRVPPPGRGRPSRRRAATALPHGPHYCPARNG